MAQMVLYSDIIYMFIKILEILEKTGIQEELN
jgi:hypothetical protein